MRAEDLRNGRGGGARPLNYPIREVPHLVLEVTKACNMRCRACYSRSSGAVKSRAELRSELRRALTRRRAGVITLIGGEPTLHPDLAGIVADVKRRGLRCQLLTNGLALLAPGGGALLDDLKSAGLDRIIVHIDEGQAHVHRDIESARTAVFDQLEARGFRFGVSVTIYPETAGSLARILRRYARYRRFDSVLATLAREPSAPPPPGLDLATEHRALKEGLGVRPCAYLPSNDDDFDVRWLVYALFLRPGGGRALAVPPRLYARIAALYRLLKGLRLYVPFARLPGLRLVEIQSPPLYGETTFCRSCPDATLRNGRITPVCFADRINPLGGAGGPEGLGPADRRSWEIAYGHLGELADPAR